MYTAEIGKIIFERWRERVKQPDTTVREYFDGPFFNLFFDDERYLMLANNSKFDQAYKQKKKKPLTAEVRQAALADFHNAIDEVEGREGHLFMGGYTKNAEDATSSMISRIQGNVDSDEIYYSWLGMAAGIGVKGGVSLLINDPEILDQIVEGWEHYRSFMQKTSSLKPHQIDTWNGWWLVHRNRLRGYQPDDPLANFPPSGSVTVKNEVAAFNTVDWIKVFFALSDKLGAQRLPAYVYSFGQTNTSIGFIPIILQDVRKLKELYQQLFGAKDFSREKDTLNELYQTQLGFLTACQMGAIGLRAMEPKDLRKYMSTGSTVGKSIKTTDADTAVSFKTYQTWIIAMLNNTELLLGAEKLATELVGTSPSKRGKKVLDQLVNAVLEASGKRKFIEALTDLLENQEFRAQREGKSNTIFDEMVTEIVAMPSANVPLFLTLLRFKYAFNNQK